jgi:adenylylsulfate kinase-like enzyme
LPGSGKSTVAKLVASKARGPSLLISMDSIRKKMFPKPTYSAAERDAAYRSFVLIGSFLSSVGITVILDGTGHKLVWREFARSQCKRFVEVYLKCPIEICIERETKRTNNDMVRKRLYANALARLKKGKRIRRLGKMPGVDEPFEESKRPDLILDSSSGKPKTLAKIVVDQLSTIAPEAFSN